MDKLIEKIKILNEIYKVFKNNTNKLKTLFKKGSLIHQKIIFLESFLDNIYISILENLESKEINKQFLDIIKDIKNGQKKNR